MNHPLSEFMVFKDLKGRFIAALTLIALLSTIGFGLAAYISERGALNEDLRADLIATANFKKSQAVDWLNQCSADVKMLAINKSNRDNLSKFLSLEDELPVEHAQSKSLMADPRVITMLTAMLTNNLLSLQQSRVGYNRIVIADQAGRVRLTTDPTLYGQSIAHDAAFHGTVTASNGAYIHDIHRQPGGASGQYQMEFGYIINPDLATDHPAPANTIGVVLLTVDLNETLFPLLRGWRMGNTGEIFLHLAQNDTTLTINANSVSLLHTSIFAADGPVSAQLSDNEFESSTETSDEKGTPIVAAYRRITEKDGPNLDWQFIVKMDLREIYAPLYALLTHVALLAIVILCITIFASVFVAKTLSQPLAELVLAAQAVALGNLKTKINVARNDEIGHLATSFQVMIHALDQRQSQLEAANVMVRNIATENSGLILQLKTLNLELETKIRQRTRDLAQANRCLQKLDDMKSAFLLNVSHELRSPVTNLKFNLDLLHRELVRTNAQSPKSERYIGTLTKHLDVLVRIIEDMLSLLQLEREKDNISFITVDLNMMVEATLADCKTQIKDAELKLIYLPAANLPQVKAEPIWLVQMLTYLLNNAILYNKPAGHIRISTHLNSRGQVGFQVEDTGMGMSSEEIAHIFERFYRGPLVNESAISGTGLGLSIVKEIVQLHQGQIEVESQLNQGSIFRVWLPIDKMERRTERLLLDNNLVTSKGVYVLQKTAER